jgi:hypothetical protein
MVVVVSAPALLRGACMDASCAAVAQRAAPDRPARRDPGARTPSTIEVLASRLEMSNPDERSGDKLRRLEPWRGLMLDVGRTSSMAATTIDAGKRGSSVGARSNQRAPARCQA